MCLPRGTAERSLTFHAIPFPVARPVRGVYRAAVPVAFQLWQSLVHLCPWLNLPVWLTFSGAGGKQVLKLRSKWNYFNFQPVLTFYKRATETAGRYGWLRVKNFWKNFNDSDDFKDTIPGLCRPFKLAFFTRKLTIILYISPQHLCKLLPNLHFFHCFENIH